MAGIVEGSIDLAGATAVIDGARARARELDCSPLTIAVLDNGGHLVALHREDRSGTLRVEIAVGKASGALGMRLPSRELQRRGETYPWLVHGLLNVSNGQMVPVAGGVLIRSQDAVIGAVGVSGDTSEPDEDCAVHGIRGAGYEADATSSEPW